MNVLTPLTLLVAGLRVLGQKFLAQIVQLAAIEASSELQAQSVDAQRKGLEVTLEALTHVNRLDTADASAAEKELIEAFREGVIGLAKANRALMTQPLEPDEVRTTLAAPFDDASSCGMPSANGHPTPPAINGRTTPHALSNGSHPNGSLPAASDPAPVKRKRGRPRKGTNPPPEQPPAS